MCVVCRRDDRGDGQRDDDEGQPQPDGIRQWRVRADDPVQQEHEGEPKRPEDNVDAEHSRQVLGVLPHLARDLAVGAWIDAVDAGDNEDPCRQRGRNRNAFVDVHRQLECDLRKYIRRDLGDTGLGEFSPVTVAEGHHLARLSWPLSDLTRRP